MTELEQAVLTYFDPRTAGPTKDAAERYLKAIQAEPGHLQTCIEAVAGARRPEVQFWCLKAILETVQQGAFQQAAAEDRIAVCRAVLAWGFSPAALCLSAPPFVRNKVAQLLAHLVAQNYPSGAWPTCIQDMLGALAHRTEHADMFVRALLALDQDVISLEIPRNDAESRRSMALKDALRARDIADVARAWTHVVRTQRGIAAACLAAVQKYADWVDIALLAADDFVALLFELLNGDAELQGAAAGTLSAILAKRMDAQPKLQLIAQLGLVPVAERWHTVLPGCDAGDAGAAVQIAGLLNVLAFEVIESVKRLENHVISMQALGLNVDQAVVQQVAGTFNSGVAMLQQLMPAVLCTLRYREGGVCAACAPFLTSYLARVKNVAKRQGGELDEDSQRWLLLILQGVAGAIRFPQDSAIEARGAASAEAEIVDTDEEAAVEDVRVELLLILRAATRLVPEVAVGAAHAALRAALEPPAGAAPPAWQDVECAVVVVYEMAEPLVDEVGKAGCGLFEAPVLLLMTAAVPHAGHRLVAAALLETYLRFVKVAAQHAEVIPGVMRTYLGECGLAHAHAPLATRACYLLMRALKALRPSLKPYLRELIEGLVPRVQSIAAHPACPTAGPLKGTAGRGIVGVTTQLDDRLYAWEAMSLLLASDDVPEDTQAHVVHGLLQFLCQQITDNLTGDLSAVEVMASSPPAPTFGRLGTAPPPRCDASQTMMLLNHALESMARLSKGFSNERMTKRRPRVGVLFSDVLDVALRVPQQLPRNKVLRTRFIAYLHRMVECLGVTIVPFLPRALAALLHEGCDVGDFTDALRLVNQLIATFPRDVERSLAGLLPAVVMRAHDMLPPKWDWTGAAAAALQRQNGNGTGSTEAVRELGELQVALHALVTCVVANDLLATLQDGPALSRAIDATILGGEGHVVAQVRKQCIAALRRMLAQLAAQPSFRSVALDGIGVRCCLRGLCNGSVDVRDGGALGLLAEAAHMMCELHAAYGDAFDTAARAYVAAEEGSRFEAEWQEVLMAITAEDAARAKTALKALLRAKQARAPRRLGTSAPQS